MTNSCFGGIIKLQKMKKEGMKKMKFYLKDYVKGDHRYLTLEELKELLSYWTDAITLRDIKEENGETLFVYELYVD